MNGMFAFLGTLESILWERLVVCTIFSLGLYFLIRSKVYPLRHFFSAFSFFISRLRKKNDGGKGEDPIKLFFASLGGCIGISNLVMVCHMIHVGGPGVLFWMWVVALLGIPMKYSEIYLGMKYRQPKEEGGGFLGGPMYFLQRAFRSPWFARCMALLLCIYGVEIFVFNTIRDSLVENSFLPRGGVILFLLLSVFWGGMRGIGALENISSRLIPLFIFVFCSAVLWVLAHHLYQIPSLFLTIFRSAFTGQATASGLLSGGLSLAFFRGVQFVCYSSDIGMGYSSIIHSESCEKSSQKQASLALLDLFFDIYVVATAAGLVILATGVWKEPLPASLYLQKAFEPYLPYSSLFMPFFIFLVGYTTIIAYLHTGQKCAQFLSPSWGKPLFTLYALFAFIFFSFYDTEIAMSLIMVVGGFLLLLNLIGIFRLRREICFD